MLSDPYDTGPYLQWEIRDVFWAHEDGTDKRRKALLISDDEYNRTNLFLRFLKFSRTDRPSPYRVQILRTDQEWNYMKLPKECFLYVDKSQRVPKSKVSKLQVRLELCSARRSCCSLGKSSRMSKRRARLHKPEKQMLVSAGGFGIKGSLEDAQRDDFSMS